MDRVARFFSRTFVRMIAGYLLIVCVPISVFSVLYLQTMDERVRTEFAAQKRQLILQSASQLAMQMQVIEKAHTALQINGVFCDYLNVGDDTQRYIYDYNKYIKFYLSDIRAIDRHIQGIWVYMDNPYLARLKAEFLPLTYNVSEYRTGTWSYGLDGLEKEYVFRYRRNIYDNRYANFCCVLEIDVRPDIIYNYFVSGTEDASYLLQHPRKVMLDTSRSAADFSEEDWDVVERSMKGMGAFLSLGDRTINSVYIDGLDAYYVAIETYPKDMADIRLYRRQTLWMTSGTLLAFSLFYYWIIAGLMHRIDRFSRHIRSTDVLVTYQSKPYRDELGQLIESFNAMVVRISDLMRSLHREEVLKQEAAYAALQTKVQPHFLYGTLETIRMLAVHNGDDEVAKLTFAFGKLMRYSLGDSSQVTLKDEVESALDYLAVTKMRMEERLEYCVHLPVELEDVICPRFILQPVAENAVTHGVAKLMRNGSIEITACERGSDVLVTVRDNGAGMDKARLEEIRGALESGDATTHLDSPGNGFALYSVHSRLRQFYGAGWGLVIDSIPDEGTTVVLTLTRKEG